MISQLAPAHLGVPGPDEVAQVCGNGWTGQVDALEQPVDGVTQLGGMQPEPAAVPVGPLPRRRPHADDPLRVVAVRAALEERDCAVGEPGNAVERRLGSDGELVKARRRRRDRLARAFEQGQLAVRGDRRPGTVSGTTGGGGSGCPRSTRSSTVAAPRSTSTGPFAAPPRASSRRPRRFEHPSDRRLAVRVHGVADGARDDEPFLRTRHRHVVETEALRPLRVLPLRLDVLVGDGADPGSRRRMRDLEAEAPVREGEDVGDGRAASARVRDHDDLELEALGRVDRE